MDNFIVSARKYRPATFASVVGQLYYLDAEECDQPSPVAHAYLFAGRGVGKTTCARSSPKRSTA
ncbi:MAG: hypothetical protein ACLUEV_01005 [Alistipes sp.]